jgi:hypothetical protein
MTHLIDCPDCDGKVTVPDKAYVVTSIKIYGDKLFPQTWISVRRSYRGNELKERLYSNKKNLRNFKRVLAVLNGSNYERKVESAPISFLPIVTITRKVGV